MYLVHLCTSTHNVSRLRDSIKFIDKRSRHRQGAGFPAKTSLRYAYLVPDTRFASSNDQSASNTGVSTNGCYAASKATARPSPRSLSKFFSPTSDIDSGWGRQKAFPVRLPQSQWDTTTQENIESKNSPYCSVFSRKPSVAGSPQVCRARTPCSVCAIAERIWMSCNSWITFSGCG